MTERQFYCVQCRRRIIRSADHICVRKTRNNRFQMVSSCEGCKYDLYKFVSKDRYPVLAKRYGTCK